MEFLKKYAIFTNWSSAQLTSVFLSLKKQRLKRNHTVFKQGDVTNNLYFIQSGEFEVFNKKKKISIKIKNLIKV